MEEPNKTLPWTKEETDRVVAVFELLISMDKKQNPHLYEIKKETNNRPEEKITKHK